MFISVKSVCYTHKIQIMKKVLLSALFILLSFNVYSQTGTTAIMPKIGYQTEFKRVFAGIEGRYFLTNNIRLAPDAYVLFPKNNIWGLDININLHYVFPMEGGLSFYSLVGGAMLNNHWSPDGPSRSWTDFGLNLGAGLQYDLATNGFLNFEFKYTIKEEKDPAYFTVGYGVRF